MAVDEQLKRRLLGTTVIVALAVIFVPMFFDEKDGEDPAETASVIPPLPKEMAEKELSLPGIIEDVARQEGDAGDADVEDAGGYRIIPLQDESASEERPAAGTAASSGAGAEEPREIEAEEGAEPDQAAGALVPVPPLPPPAASPESGQTESAQVPAKVAPQSPSRGGDAKSVKRPAVQNAPSGKAKPAGTAPQKGKVPADKAITPLGTKPSVDGAAAGAAPSPKPARVMTASGSKIPVAKPPESLRPAASPPRQTEKSLIAAKGDTQAKLPASSPAAAARASETSAKGSATPSKTKGGDASSGAWVIQAGNFTAESSAKALADKLRKAKFPAVVKAIPGEKGSIYRVDVGPELERGRAEQIQKQLESSVGIRGILAPHR